MTEGLPPGLLCAIGLELQVQLVEKSLGTPLDEVAGKVYTEFELIGQGTYEGPDPLEAARGPYVLTVSHPDDPSQVVGHFPIGVRIYEFPNGKFLVTEEGWALSGPYKSDEALRRATLRTINDILTDSDILGWGTGGEAPSSVWVGSPLRPEDLRDSFERALEEDWENGGGSPLGEGMQKVLGMEPEPWKDRVPPELVDSYLEHVLGVKLEPRDPPSRTESVRVIETRRQGRPYLLFDVDSDDPGWADKVLDEIDRRLVPRQEETDDRTAADT